MLDVSHDTPETVLQLYFNNEFVQNIYFTYFVNGLVIRYGELMEFTPMASDPFVTSSCDVIIEGRTYLMKLDAGEIRLKMKRTPL